MGYSESEIQRVTQIAKQVFLLTSRLKIPLTQENYFIWYEYVIGRNQELSKELDDIRNNGNGFNAEISENIFQKYFEKDIDHNIIKQVHQETKKVIYNIVEELVNTSRATSSYGVKLEDFSQQLDFAEQMPQIKPMIAEMIKDTGEMAQSSRSLQNQLKEAALQTEKLKQELKRTEREAYRDALTGLHNRRAFDRKIIELIDNYQETGKIFSAIMIDIDHFKKFNDTYGHKIGDGVLQITAMTLHRNLKGDDFPARYGGEEFCVLLPDTHHINAKKVAEALRTKIAYKKLKISKTGRRLGQITASFGVAQFKQGDNESSIIERADKALYMAKESGRNKVMTEKDLSY